MSRVIDKKIKVGIIGCGAIGGFIARSIEKPILNKRLKIVAVCDSNKEKASKLKEDLSTSVEILELEDLLDRADLVVEAASAKISFAVAKKSLEKGKDVLCMSIGGLVERFESLKKLSEKNKCHLYLPSGAICGLDGVKAASEGRIKSVRLTTMKPPKGLKGAPYIVEKGIDLDKIKDETLIFRGRAKEALRAFPQNVNVAAALSLCGIGAKRTIVKVITSPKFTKNTHTIEVEGDFGKITTTSVNLPSKENPKTSALAMLSAVAKLREIASFVNVGT